MIFITYLRMMNLKKKAKLITKRIVILFVVVFVLFYCSVYYLYKLISVLILSRLLLTASFNCFTICLDCPALALDCAALAWGHTWSDRYDFTNLCKKVRLTPFGIYRYIRYISTRGDIFLL